MTACPLTPLGDIATLQAGVGFPLEMQGRKTGDYPLAKVGDISRAARSGQVTLSTADHYVSEEDLIRLKATPIPAGSILFSKIGETIRQNYRVVAGRPLLIDNNAMAAIPGGRIASRFLYHFLRTVDFYELASATTVPALRKSRLAKVLVPVPSIEEQLRLSQILDMADAVLAKCRAVLVRLDVLAQSIFVHMFGDPATNSKHWPERAIGELCATSSGGTPRRNIAAYFGGDIPWVKSGELRDPVVRRTEETISVAGLENSSAKLLPRGTVLIAMYGATAGAVSQLGIDAAINQAICAIAPSRELKPGYLIHMLRMMTQILLSKRVGGAQPNLSQELIRGLIVPVPGEKLQTEFVERISVLDEIRGKSLQAQDSARELYRALVNETFRHQ